jgi:hypothetical protein
VDSILTTSYISVGPYVRHHLDVVMLIAVLDRIEIRAIEKAGSKITGDVSSRSAEMDTYWRVASLTTAISPVLPYVSSPFLVSRLGSRLLFTISTAKMACSHHNSQLRTGVSSSPSNQRSSTPLPRSELWNRSRLIVCPYNSSVASCQCCRSQGGGEKGRHE